MSFKIVGNTSKNTIDAFREVLSQGADGIALGIARSKDGQLIIPNEKQPRDDAPVKLSRALLREMAEEKLPALSFENVLDLVVERNDAYKAQTGENLIIDVAIADAETARDIHATMAAYVAQGKLEKESFLFNSSDKSVLREMQALDNDANLVLNTENDHYLHMLFLENDLSESEYGLSYHALNCPLKEATPALVNLCQQSDTGLCASMDSPMKREDIALLKAIHTHADQLPVVFVKTKAVDMTVQAREFLMSDSDMTSDEERLLEKRIDFSLRIQKLRERDLDRQHYRKPHDYGLDMDR